MYVNKAFLDVYFDGFDNDEDEEAELYHGLDVNNEAAMKQLIADVLLPAFAANPEEYKALAKRTLSYYLTTDRADLEDVFDSVMPPIDMPANIKALFVWVWQVFYGDEDYQMADWQKCKEQTDYNEPLAMLIRHK
jgi:hypothetical protein